MKTLDERLAEMKQKGDQSNGDSHNSTSLDARLKKMERMGNRSNGLSTTTGTGAQNAPQSLAASNAALTHSGLTRDAFDSRVRSNYAAAQKTGAPVLTGSYGGGGGRGGLTQAQIQTGVERAESGKKFSGTAGVFSAPKLVEGALVKGTDQAMADRGMEYTAGRKSLNWGNKVISSFGRAQVSGNVSSVLNQTAQLSQILAEAKGTYVAKAAADLAKGTGGRIWNIKKTELFNQSDLLTGKKGIEYLTADDSKIDRYTAALFKPADIMKMPNTSTSIIVIDWRVRPGWTYWMNVESKTGLMKFCTIFSMPSINGII